METADTLQALGRPVEDARRAFLRLIEPHRADLWRYCLRLTGSAWDAADLVQETLMKAFARLTGWEPLDARPYLFRIASNTWIDGLRRRRIETVELDESRAPAAEEPDVIGTWAAMLHTTEGAVKAALHRARAGLKEAASGERGSHEPASARTASGCTASVESAPVEPAQPRARVAPPSAVVAAYLDAFNRRDPDAIAALLTDGATCDIVECGVEYGKETIRKYSLEDWAKDPLPQWAEYGELDGRPVVYVYFRTDAHGRALGQLVTLETQGDRITAMRLYYFTPEIIRYAAARLGVPDCAFGYYHQF